MTTALCIVCDKELSDFERSIHKRLCPSHKFCQWEENGQVCREPVSSDIHEFCDSHLNEMAAEAIAERNEQAFQELQTLQSGDDLLQAYLQSLQYEEQEELERNRPIGDRILERYITLFNATSTQNEMYAHQTLHVLLGQKLKHIRIRVQLAEVDLRYSCAFMQDSGTGKTTPVGFVKQRAQKLTIPWTPLTGFTEAHLVGSYVQIGKTKETKYGALYDSGIIWIDEAKGMFVASKKQINTELFTYIQTALNPIGNNRILKGLKDGPIDYESSSSIVLVTHHINIALFSELLDTGLFQRVMPFVHKMSFDEWAKLYHGVGQMMMRGLNKERMLEILRNSQEQELKLDMDLKEIVEFAKGVRYMEAENEQEIEQELTEFMEKDFLAKVRHLRDDLKDILLTFGNRLQVTLFVIASHRALMDKRNIIRRSDMAYARSFVNTTFYSLVDFLSKEKPKGIDSAGQRWNELSKNWRVIEFGSADSYGFFKISEVVLKLSKFFGVVERVIYSDIVKWEERGFVKRDAEKRMIMFKVGGNGH